MGVSGRFRYFSKLSQHTPQVQEWESRVDLDFDVHRDASAAKHEHSTVSRLRARPSTSVHVTYADDVSVEAFGSMTRAFSDRKQHSCAVVFVPGRQLVTGAVSERQGVKVFELNTRGRRS